MRARVLALVILSACGRTSPTTQVEPAPVAVTSALESPSSSLPPAAPIAEASPSMAAAPACRTASDCPTGELCCRSTLTPNGQECMQPDTVDGEPCILQACVVDAGAPCPAGQACRDGFCRPSPRERATCNGIRCPEGQPFCGTAGGAWSCSAEPGLACTKPSDCGAGMHCCTSDAPAGGAITTSECARACAPPVTEDICEKDKDCPPLFVTGADHGLRQRPCSRRPTPGSPPRLRLCGTTVP